MSVMRVGYVWVLVLEWLVSMRVRVRLSVRVVWPVRVLMMLVVAVRVLVLQRLMNVGMTVALAQEEHDTCAHDPHRDPINSVHRLVEQ